MHKYIIEFLNDKNAKVTETFDTIEDAFKFFKNMDSIGQQVALYNLK